MANFITQALRRVFPKRLPEQVAKFLGRDVKVGAELLLDPRRAAAEASGKAFQEFAQRATTAQVYIADTPAGKAFYDRLVAQHSSWEGGAGYFEQGDFIAIDPERVRQTFRNIATRRGLAPKVIERALGSEDFLKVVLYHEVLERDVSRRFAAHLLMPAQHKGSQVLLGEAGFIRQLGNKDLKALFRAVRSGREEERLAFRVGYNLFSAKDDEWNTIQGLRHGGMAEWMRRILTDFGSGYDAVRAMAKAMGKTFEEIIESSAWKEALGGAKVVKELGAGAFGRAELVEFAFEGRAIQAAKKSFRPLEEVEARFGQHAQRYIGPAREVASMRALGETPLVPSFYGGTEEQIFMEYMPGKRLSEFNWMERFVLPLKARKEFEETARAAANAGIFNVDIHGGNVLWDPTTKRAAWIDWGLAKIEGVKSEVEADLLHEAMIQYARGVEGIFHPLEVIRKMNVFAKPGESGFVSFNLGSRRLPDTDRLTPAIPQELSGPPTDPIKLGKRKPKPGPVEAKLDELKEQLRELARKKDQEARDLALDKAQVWDNAYYGGRNHQKRKSSFNSMEKRWFRRS